MKVSICLLVGLDDRARMLAQAAANQVLPHAEQVVYATLPEALQREPDCGGELLVLARMHAGDLEDALAAADPTARRRWAIVFLGPALPSSGVEVILPGDISELVLARAFRSAIAQHHLIRNHERALGDLRAVAWRITHDLRTPLGGILSAGEALEEMCSGHDPGYEATAASLFDSVDELGRMIDRVSLLLKASANPLPSVPLAMGDVLWAVLQRHERQILKRNARVTQPDSWPEVEGVAAWLTAVWGNLLSNALMHGTPPAQIELGWRQDGRSFRFWVADNGEGVPPEKQAALFQPFHLLYRTNARKGLGLSIVQRLVELQGGICGYEARPGGGSLFYFTLPASGGQPDQLIANLKHGLA